MVDESEFGFMGTHVGIQIDHNPKSIQKSFLSRNPNGIYAVKDRARLKELDKTYRISRDQRQVIQGDSFAIFGLTWNVLHSVNLVITDGGFYQPRRAVSRSFEGATKHVALVCSGQMPLHIAFSARNEPNGRGVVNGRGDDPSAFRISSGADLIRHDASLTAIYLKSEIHHSRLQKTNDYEQPCKNLDPVRSLLPHLLLAMCCIGLWRFGDYLLDHRWRRLGVSVFFVGSVGLLSVLGDYPFGDPLAFWRFRWLLGEDEYCEYQPLHNGTIVLQKYLDKLYCCSTVIDMANVLNPDKKIAIIGALAEGSSIRSIERITGVHRDTIMRLGVKVGQGCATLLDAKMRDLPCHHLQFDEIWGFIGKKQRNLLVDDDETQFGDVWTFCAIDAETKLVPSFRCGKRDAVTANAFVEDVASRMRTRVQVTTDALRLYVEAIERGFGADVDYGRVIKTYAHDDSIHPERRYSAPEIVTTEKEIVNGHPDMELASTSHVERLNGTTRLHMRRLTRLTYAFSKKLENFKAAAALHFAYYNFVKRHGTLRCTPAMAAGVEQSFWSVGDLVEAAA